MDVKPFAITNTERSVIHHALAFYSRELIAGIQELRKNQNPSRVADLIESDCEQLAVTSDLLQRFAP